jgi:hypothetical protein
MTKIMEELESGSSTSSDSGKVNIMATDMSYQQCSIVAFIWCNSVSTRQDFGFVINIHEIVLTNHSKGQR